MTGAIPPYGEHFRRERLDEYTPGLASRRYVLKADPGWYIRSDSTSEKWFIFQTHSKQPVAVEDTFTAAMIRLQEGLDLGYYQTTWWWERWKTALENARVRADAWRAYYAN